jgi:hypothetical protein
MCERGRQEINRLVKKFVQRKVCERWWEMVNWMVKERTEIKVEKSLRERVD